MSQIYDNWEKLVGAVLKREQLRRLALSDSINSSYISSSSSSFNLGSASPFPGYAEHSGRQFERGNVRPPQPNEFKWEIDHAKLDFSDATFISKGSSGGLIKASWYRTPVAVKRIIPSFSDESLVIQDFRNEINLLMKLRHPNIVQFLGAVTERKPLLFITEYLTGGSLDQHVKEKGPLSSSTAIDFAMDIARGMAYLHGEPNVVILRDLQPRNVFLVNTSGDHLKVGDFGLSKLINVQNSPDVYRIIGETESYHYMAPEVFKNQEYDKKADVFSFAMILYEMLEGDPPLSNYEPYEAARYMAEGHRPIIQAKGSIPALRELTEQCWAGDINQRPSFLQILRKLDNIRDKLPSRWKIFAS